MRLEGFTAEADLVGHRVKARWRLVADPGESVAGEPPLRLLAKERDFEFGDDPGDHLVVDTARWLPDPGPDVDVVEVRRPAERDGDRRVLVDVVTVARRTAVLEPDLSVPPEERGDGWVEVLRRTRTTVVDAAGRAVEREDEVLDVGAGAGLPALVPRYYELRGPLAEASGRPLRAVATPTAAHRTGRLLYDLVPGVWRRHDVPPAALPGGGRVGAIPESNLRSGPLRRMVDLFGVGADHLRSRADGLRSLYDVEEVDARYLPHLAHLVGWELGPGLPVPLQRHEVRYAARLYGLTGTVPGVQLWAKRSTSEVVGDQLTSWDVRVKEFAENVLFSNDPGGEDGPTRSGSFTVDTSDPALLASMGTADDGGDYTYDTGTGPDDRYSSHTIGIFATPDPVDRVDDVARKRDRLLAATDRYLPANLRAVVILPDEPVTTGNDHVLGVSASRDQHT